MLGLLETSKAEEAGRVWIGLQGRTSSKSKMEEQMESQGAEKKAKTPSRKVTDHEFKHKKCLNAFAINFHD